MIELMTYWLLAGLLGGAIVSPFINNKRPKTASEAAFEADFLRANS